MYINGIKQPSGRILDSTGYIKDLRDSGFSNVPGMLRKTHPHSVFISFKVGSEWDQTLFCGDPFLRVRLKGETRMSKHRATVLQVMMGFDSTYLCEVFIADRD